MWHVEGDKQLPIKSDKDSTGHTASFERYYARIAVRVPIQGLTFARNGRDVILPVRLGAYVDPTSYTAD